MRLANLLFVAPLLLPVTALAAPETVKGTASDGTRFYEDSLVIQAPAKQVWAAFTDGAVYRRWSVPVAAIDFRLGGVIEASYDPKGHLGDPQNIKNELVAYIPERLLVFRNVQAPDMLPGKELYGKTVKTIEFQPMGWARPGSPSRASASAKVKLSMRSMPSSPPAMPRC